MIETEHYHHYQVLRRPDGALWELGRGAMGVTYKAFDTNLRCPVALKVINAAYLHSETARTRFLREARAAAGLSHPNVAAAFHLGQDTDSFFYAMEFVDGETLDALVRRQGALPAALALRIALQVARALRAAHRIGLVHRDIKPANLMVVREAERPAGDVLANAAANLNNNGGGTAGDDDDEDDIHVKVIDFGLAKTLRREGDEEGNASSAASLTMGGFVGTPHFASPEQLEEKEIDTRSDIYSLGATLWFALTGKPPFSGSMAQIMSQHLSRLPPFENLRVAGVPVPAVALLQRMLAKDPAARPQTPSDLRREIESALRALQPRAAASAASTAAAAFSTGAPTTATGEDMATVADADSAAPTAHGVVISAEGGSSGINPKPPSTGGELSSGASAPLLPPLAPGAVVVNRYRLLRAIGPEGGRGQLFQAMDTGTGEPVAVKFLPTAITENEEALAGLSAEVEKAREPAAAHPGLLAIHALTPLGDRPGALLAMEWAESFPLLEALRHRHQLTVREVLAVLEPLAAAADHARAHGLDRPDLALGQVLLVLENTSAPPPESTQARTALLSAPLDAWPPFRPKILPLTLPDPAALGDPTWAGGRTFVGGQHPGVDVTAVPLSRRLAGLAVELLGGGSSSSVVIGSVTRFTPLAALSERGNVVLRTALVPAAAGGSPAYATGGEFVRALREAADRPGEIPPVAPGAGSFASAGVTRLPAAVPVSRVTTVTPPPVPVVAASVVPPPPPPSVVPTTPAARPPARAGMSGVLVAGIVLGALVALGAAAGAVVYYGWRTYSTLTAGGNIPTTPGGGNKPRVKPTPATPDPTPPIAPTPIPTAEPVAFNPTPTPGPTPTTAPSPSASPAVDAETRYQTMAAEAARIDRSGDYAGALEAWLGLAREFPERDAGRTGLDGVIANLRKDFPPETEAGARRFRQLRPLAKLAADAGSQSAMLYVADAVVDTEPQQANFWYRTAAERGQPRAMIALGNSYFRGRGLPADPAQAVRWYEKASDRGDALAKVYLGECYQEGYGGVRRDPRHAFELYNEALAIEPNNPRALDKLGYCYANGQGTVPDGRKAMEFTRRAAEMGNLNATLNLGAFYMQGTGLSRPDPAKGAELFRQGAEKDNAGCMYNYARCLEAGLGVRSSPNEARRWFRAAAERGHPGAMEWCRRAGVSFTAPGGGT